MHEIFKKSLINFTGALVVFFLVFSPSQTIAQDRAQKSVITQLLWQSLLQCYSIPVESIRLDDLVIIQVELNTKGDIADLPNIVTPKRLSDGERALLREATIALINCTPFISQGGAKAISGSFQIVANQDGLSIAKVEAEVTVSDVVPAAEVFVAIEIQDDPIEIVEDIAVDTVAPVLNGKAREATPEDEDALELTKTDRRELQRRLSLLDYNTRGVDGVFGPGSRKAIQAWQTDNDIPPSGYFDANQIARLHEMSETKYVAWKSRPTRYTDRNGCLREASGKIVEGRSFKCDLNAAGQSLGVSR